MEAMRKNVSQAFTVTVLWAISSFYPFSFQLLWTYYLNFTFGRRLHLLLLFPGLCSYKLHSSSLPSIIPFFPLHWIIYINIELKKKKKLPANALDIRDTGSISPSVRCPGRGHSNPLQCSLTGSIGLQRVRHHWSNIACIEMLFHFSILQTKQSKPKKNQTKTNNKHQIAQFLFQTR